MKKILFLSILFLTVFVPSKFSQAMLPPPSAIFSFDIDKKFVENSIWELTLFNLNEFGDKELVASKFGDLMKEYIKVKEECGQTTKYLEKVGEITSAIANNYIKQGVIDNLKENERYFGLGSSYRSSAGPKILYRLKDKNYLQCLGQIIGKTKIDAIIYPTEVALDNYYIVQQYKNGSHISFEFGSYFYDAYEENKNKKEIGGYENVLIYPINFRSFYKYYFNKNPFVKEIKKQDNPYMLAGYLNSFVYIDCNITGDKYNDLSANFNYNRYSCNFPSLYEDELNKQGPFIVVLEKLDSGEVYYSGIVDVPFSEVENIVWNSSPNPNDNKLKINKLEIQKPNKLIIQFEGAKLHESQKGNVIIEFIGKYYQLFIAGLILLFLLIFLIYKVKKDNNLSLLK
jgi:hypothetical protein